MSTTTQRMDYYLSLVKFKNNPVIDTAFCVNVPFSLYKNDALCFGDFYEKIVFKPEWGVREKKKYLHHSATTCLDALNLFIALIGDLNKDFPNSKFYYENLRGFTKYGEKDMGYR